MTRRYIQSTGDVKRRSKPGDAAVQIVLIGAFDLRGDDVADA
jgi:hypothetical protein